VFEASLALLPGVDGAPVDARSRNDLVEKHSGVGVSQRRDLLRESALPWRSLRPPPFRAPRLLPPAPGPTNARIVLELYASEAPSRHGLSLGSPLRMPRLAAQVCRERYQPIEAVHELPVWCRHEECAYEAQVHHQYRPH